MKKAATLPLLTGLIRVVSVSDHIQHCARPYLQRKCDTNKHLQRGGAVATFQHGNIWSKIISTPFVTIAGYLIFHFAVFHDNVLK